METSEEEFGCSNFGKSTGKIQSQNHEIAKNPNGTLCCICGDVGFQDQLFKCKRCLTRFQHKYCSNSYLQSGWKAGICEWCIHEESKKLHGKVQVVDLNCYRKRNTENEESVIQDAEETAKCTSSSSAAEEAEKCSKNPGLVRTSSKGKMVLPAPKTTNRRYKLLKDVLC